MRLERGRAVHLETPPPRPWPSSVPVGLSGVTTWPGPQRSTAARVATTSAIVAACDAEQLLWKAAGDANKENGYAWDWWWWLVVVVGC